MLNENKIKSGQSIFDIANIYYGGINNILTLIELNPQFESIDVDLENFATEDFVYDDQYYTAPAYTLELKTPKVSPVYTSIFGLENQNIFNIIMMGSGSLNALIPILVANGDVFNLNDQEVAGKECKFDSLLVVNNAVVAEIAKKGYKLASGSEGMEIDSYRITDDGFTRITDGLEIRML